MICNVEKLNNYQRPDLIQYVYDHCVAIQPEQRVDLYRMTQWCINNISERRDGDILFEAMDGQLDYFDGDWQDFVNHLDLSQYLFWFYKKQDRTLFTLTWL